MKGISIMTDEFFEDENVDDEENNLEYDRDIFDIEIEFDDEVVKRIERTETAREFEKLIESEEQLLKQGNKFLDLNFNLQSKLLMLNFSQNVIINATVLQDKDHKCIKKGEPLTLLFPLLPKFFD